MYRKNHTVALQMVASEADLPCIYFVAETAATQAVHPHRTKKITHISPIRHHGCHNFSKRNTKTETIPSHDTFAREKKEAAFVCRAIRDLAGRESALLFTRRRRHPSRALQALSPPY
jgi:hypothetical protein